jgi:hypothetical protein
MYSEKNASVTVKEQRKVDTDFLISRFIRHVSTEWRAERKSSLSSVYRRAFRMTEKHAEMFSYQNSVTANSEWFGEFDRNAVNSIFFPENVSNCW